jgi:DNA segregation ATPase FtsK/SpoIIIE-like protein
MSTTSRVAGAVAAGYLLGRFKKLRLAILVGSAMSSPKFRSAAAGMIQDRLPGGAVVGTLTKEVGGKLTKEVGGKLVDVGKTAATSIVASRIDSLSQSLADRSQNLRKGQQAEAGKSRAEEQEGDEQEAEEPEDEYEEQEAEEPEDEEQEAEEPEDEEQEAEEPEDEYEEQEAEEPEDEYEEQEAEEPEDEEQEAEEPEDQNAQADDDASRDEEPEEPVARSPRRRRSASPAGRRRG